MNHQRSSAQTVGLCLAILLGFYSIYLQIELVRTDTYTAVFESQVEGRPLAILIAFILVSCALSLAGVCAFVALTNPTATGRATGFLLLIGVCAAVLKEVLILTEIADYVSMGSAWSAYLDSVEYASIPYKWPVIWATVTLCALASVLCFRTGRPTGAPTGPPPAQTPVFHIYSEGAQYGPFDWRQLHQLVTEGRVLSSTLVWPGEGEWIPAAEVPGLLGVVLSGDR